MKSHTITGKSFTSAIKTNKMDRLVRKYRSYSSPKNITIYSCHMTFMILWNTKENSNIEEMFCSIKKQKVCNNLRMSEGRNYHF